MAISTTRIPIILLALLLASALPHLSQAQNSNQDFLDTHNAARAAVTPTSVAAITWNSTVATYALNYANQRKADCNLVSSGGPYGESLAKGSTAAFTGVAAVNLWVGEKPRYDYTSNTCATGYVCSHYTQAVWANSVGLGCARVQCNNGWYFVACNYYVPGNVPGERPY